MCCRVEVHCPHATVLEALADPRDAWLRPFLRLAGHEGEAAGLHAWRKEPAPAPPANRKARVSVGSAELSPGGWSFPLVWSTSGYRTLFRELTGVIRVKASDAETVEVSVEGDIRPPRALSRGVANRQVAVTAAEAAVVALLDHLRAAWEESAREGTNQSL